MEERNRYAVGDLVVPVDLPRTFVCSVARAIGAGGEQLLELAPLGGPWPRGTRFVRLNDMVRRAHPTEVGPTQRTAQRRDKSRGARRRPILTVVSSPEEREHESPAVRRRPEYPGR
jgi:hypothetical protein